MPQVAVLRDLCFWATKGQAQVCEYADLWHPYPPLRRQAPAGRITRGGEETEPHGVNAANVTPLIVVALPATLSAATKVPFRDTSVSPEMF